MQFVDDGHCYFFTVNVRSAGVPPAETVIVVLLLAVPFLVTVNDAVVWFAGEPVPSIVREPPEVTV